MLEEKLTELVERLENAGANLAPEIFDATVRGAQLEGTMMLIVGGVMLTLAPVLIAVTVKLAKTVDKHKDPTAAICAISATFSGIVGCAFAMVGVVSLLWVDNWIAALDPVAYIAKTVILP